MAFTLEQLAAVESAIASGELLVEYEGKKVQYRSMNDLIDARNLMRGELIAAGLLSPPTATRISYGRRVRG